MGFVVRTSFIMMGEYIRKYVCMYVCVCALVCV
jgi:hypothetical protein